MTTREDKKSAEDARSPEVVSSLFRVDEKRAVRGDRRKNRERRIGALLQIFRAPRQLGA
jgi:hypothetical protein